MSRKRVYHFALPYDIGFFKMGVLRQRLTADPRYSQIPAQLRQKLEAGGTTVVTKEDLDQLPDAVWADIAQQAGLSYEYVDDDSGDFELGEEIGGPASKAQAPAPHAPVVQKDTKAVADKKKAATQHTNAVKQAAKAKPKPVSKGASTTTQTSASTHSPKGKK